MFQKISMLLLFSGLTACVTSSEQLQHRLNSYIGKNQTVLFSKLGAPTAAQTEGNTVYATYQLRDTFIIPIAPNTFSPQSFDRPQYNQIFGEPLQSIDEFCRVTFSLTNSIITSYSYQGDGCFNLIPAIE